MVIQRFPEALLPNQVTVLGFGALLSEASARLTFPDLEDFRLVKVKDHRRIFRHPHLFLIRQGLVKLPDLHIGSLSAEPAKDCSFIAAAFSVALDEHQRQAFVDRESEYKITTCSFYDIQQQDGAILCEQQGGVICTAMSSDDLLPEAIRPLPLAEWGLSTIWGWKEDSGLLPADVYLRHCLLAVRKAGDLAEKSFLEDTTLIDRKTTLAEYMKTNEERVMASRPPPHLVSRFSG